MSVRPAVGEVISTAMVVVAALAMLASFLQDREWFGLSPDTAAAYFEDWRGWREFAIRMGPEEANVVVAVFMDFTCPFCKDLVPVLEALAAEFPGAVAVDFHHFPLVGHRFAIPSAIAAECAHRQGRFEETYHRLYEQAESPGSRDWRGIAADAGIPDLDEFEECIQLPRDTFPRIAAGRALGTRIGVTGTPEVWINGELLQGPRLLVTFRKRVEEVVNHSGFPGGFVH